MSEPRQHQAREHRTRWPGWIWAVPIAALGIVIWLVLRSWSNSGPTVTVVFPEVANLKPEDTDVKFKDMKVGSVNSIKLEKDLRHMRVKLKLDSDLEGHLGKDAKFWIEGNNLDLNNLSALTAIVSGPYVAIQPALGQTQKVYIGLTSPPVLGFGEKGTPFVLHCGTLSGIQHGTPIYYLGQKVGEVRAHKMMGDNGFDVTAVIKAPFDKFVHTGTRFWDAGAIEYSDLGGGPKLQLRSLPALLQGAIAFETPIGPQEGPPGKAYQRFELFDGKAAAENAPDSTGIPYRVVFTGVSNSLSRYAPVQMMGTRIGSVSASQLQYSPATGQLSIAAVIVLEPSRIQLANNESWGTGRGQMDEMMRRLIAHGLRAQLTSSPPIIGGHMVVLGIVPGKKGSLSGGAVPEIPTAAGSDVPDLLQRANDIATRINEIPLTRIGDHIDQTVANLNQISASARQQLPPTLANARRSIQEAQATLASAEALMSANPALSNQPHAADVPKALDEITRAARSLREISDFLDRHPEALIKGRGTDQ